MTVTKDELQEASRKIHEKFDSKHYAMDRRVSDVTLEMQKALSDTISQIAKPLTEVATELKLTNHGFAHQQKEIELMRAENKEVRLAVSALKNEVVAISTNQNAILGVTGKVFPYIITVIGSSIALLMGISVYYKISLGI